MSALSLFQTLKMPPEDQKIVYDCIQYYQNGNNIQAIGNIFSATFGSSYWQTAEKALSKYLFKFQPLQSLLDAKTVLKQLIEDHQSCEGLSFHNLFTDFVDRSIPFGAYIPLASSYILQDRIIEESSKLVNIYIHLILSPNGYKAIDSPLDQKYHEFMKRKHENTVEELETIWQLAIDLKAYQNELSKQL